MDHRRDFLRTVVTAGLVAAAPRVAWADRFRILPADDTGSAPRETSDALARLIAGVAVGDTRTHRTLRVFWLRAPGALPFAIRTLQEANDAGDVTITERERATVDTLLVENRGKTPVLLLAGEVLAGGKQDRVVAEDVLLPAVSGAVGVAVYCVEQGRWTGERGSGFKPAAMAPPALRQRAQEPGGQHQVWAEVSRYAARSAAPSATSKYLAVETKPEVRAQQDDAGAVLGAPPADASGAAVFAGTRFTGLDLFGAPGLFAREWPKLLRSHAVEMSVAGGDAAAPADPLRERAKDLLDRIGAARGTHRRNAGLGRLFGFRVLDFRGLALEAEGHVVHASVT
ncbi:MAG: hypothetical protein HY216_07735 [Candidatus Rokubacteria bacterium]|nr:hypothetical protein [Candidatus Rokubacteria bacterium]